MPRKSPWNKGKVVGQKAPSRPRDVHTIKQLLENAGNLRDLALFSVGIDTMLRGIDLLALRVEDVMDHRGAIVEQFAIGQRKTGKTTMVALLLAWLLRRSDPVRIPRCRRNHRRVARPQSRAHPS